jgi:uncharacterized delta-60 repeat protein
MSALARIGPMSTALALALALVVAARAAPGDLDPTFGLDGRAVVSPAVEAVASAAVLQPDGKIVLAGWADDMTPPPPPPPAPHRAPVPNSDFLAVRLTPNGSLDTTFGSGGAVRTPIDLGGGVTDLAWAVALGPGGEVVLGGIAYKAGGSDFAIARYTPSGVLDSSFSGDGIATVDIDVIDTLSGVAVQADGKIVGVGRGGSGFTVIRLLPNGALDGGFGSGGIVHTVLANPSVQDEATAVLMLGDGRILVAGAADRSFPYSQTEFALVRYLPDGRLDPTFGSAGIVVTPGTREEVPYALALAPDGKIVVAGFADKLFGLARYLRAGALDSTFGVGGTVTTSFGGLYASARSVVVQRDGKIVAGGSMRSEFPASYDAIAVARYTTDGTLDTSLWIGGKQTYDVLAGGDRGAALAIQRAATPAGTDRLVVAGQASDGDGASDHMVALGVDLGPLAPPPPTRCRVPRVVGLRLGIARTKIRRANCLVGRIRRVRARRFRGVVVSQSPRAGRRLPRGGRVNLVVGRR